MRIKFVIRLTFGLLPPGMLKNLVLNLTGWKIHRKAQIGSTIFWKTENLSMGAGSSIGSLNVFRDIVSVSLQDNANIGNLNWVSASPWHDMATAGAGTISLAASSVITNRHYIDVSGGLIIGYKSAITGVRSTIVTHGVNPVSGVQELHPVSIGSNTLVGSNATIVPGSKIGSFLVFGMGCLISGEKFDSYSLYLNSKSIPAKNLPQGSEFFRARNI